MGGSLLVARGDLTLLSCDAIVVPTSTAIEVTRPWRAVLPAEALTPSNDWFAVDVARPDGWGPQGLRALQYRDHLERHVWLVLTGWDSGTPKWVAEGLRQVVAAAADPARAKSKRDKPLIGVPLAGTGAGGLAGQRGAVIDAVLPVLRAAAEEHDVDVVLVLSDDRDYAAVQDHRDAPELHDPALAAVADELGRKAAAGELSLFLGAGVSIAAGLPTWPELLKELAMECKLGKALDSLPPLDAAQAASQLMEQDFDAWMRNRFRLQRHALAHALLAGLACPAVITTNYDNGYELAAEAVGRPVVVLPRERARPRSPWLLKLHGDIAQANSIVLTRAQYLEHGANRTPLGGMVQSQLMTGHVLFVGFSLVDDTFACLAHQVLQQLSNTPGTSPMQVGTVLHLLEDPARAQLYKEGLNHVAVSGTDEDMTIAARRLELLLDRISWSASQAAGGKERYLLDERYAGLPWSAEDQEARRVLLELGKKAPPEKTPAWLRVEELMTSLGARAR